MTCRILNAESGATPIQWNNCGKPTPPPVAARVPLYAGRSTSAAGRGNEGIPSQPADTEEQIAIIRREAERQIADAYRKGQADAGAAAQAEVAERERSRQEQLGAAIEHLATFRTRIRREAEADLVRLSLAIARRLLHRELQIDPQALLGLLKAALERIEQQETHRLRIHPALAAAAQQSLAGRGIPLEVVPDSRLAPGGAVFETRRGDVDAGLETQLAEIESGFVDLLPNGGS